MEIIEKGKCEMTGKEKKRQAGTNGDGGGRKQEVAISTCFCQ